MWRRFREIVLKPLLHHFRALTQNTEEGRIWEMNSEEEKQLPTYLEQ